MTPDSTSREPNHSTATTEAKIAKIATKVRIDRAKIDDFAASKAASTALEKRPVTSRSLVKACSVRTAPICSLA